MYPSRKYPGANYLISALLFIVLINGVVLAESEKDFEFADSESSVKKRSADTDDEDLMADEAGSTPEEVDGSGDEPKPPVDLPEFFRVTINFTELEFSRPLEDPRSDGFRTLGDQISKAVVSLYDNVSGTQSVTVIHFSPGSVVTTFDLGTQGFYDRNVLYSTLNGAVNSGYIPPYRVSPVGFSFRPLQDGRTCPDYAGRDANPLPRSGDNRANLLINNEFYCRGYIKAWEYYRIVPRYTGYVGVWRHLTDETFVLVGKTALPVDTVGNHTVIVSPKIMVEKGDFIGIFYSRDAEEGVVAKAQQGDVMERELYQNYYATFYDEDVEVGVPFSLERIPYEDTSATFAIRALMDYTGSDDDAVVLPPMTCKPDQFTCKNGQCIDGRFKCDGQVDCYDQSDESDCTPVTCQANEHRCKSGQQCIPQKFVCNGQVDCFDSSDEEGCPPVDCDSNQFKCSDGTCIDLDLRCDSRADCPDSSDELACRSKPCMEGEFRCERGHCIDATLRCDGVTDCWDNTDELDCGTASCASNEFKCRSGQCIPQQYYCDDYPDCGDGSDEIGCAEVNNCPEGQYQCDDKTCVKPNAGCDGVADCADGSDESVATCGGVAPTVAANTQEVIQGSTAVLECIASGSVTLTWSRADGRSLPAQATLSNGIMTIPNTAIQDAGTYLCSADVAAVAPVAVQLVVIPATVTLTVSRSQQVLDVGATAVFDCSASGNANVQLTWTRASQELKSGAVVQGGRLTIPSVTVEDADTYFCGVSNIAGITPAQAQLLVIPKCKDGEFKCRDGNCIPQRFKCDSFSDCEDGSDELDCVEVPSCPEGQYVCDDKSCVAAGAQCNGIQDCADGSDEFPVYCGCRPRQFMCADGKQCIDSMLECNRIPDCPDRSDEHNNCTYGCRDNEFRCSDGACIPLVEECDGIRNCGDGSDEENCPLDRCPVGDFACASGFQCVESNLVCDGYPDCTDSSDERNCRCTENQFTCSDGLCIDKRLRCDGIVHCEDSSDEAGCITTCDPNEFRCRNGDCIPSNRRCDRRSDCEDASDEENCACQANEFRCNNGDCIPARMRCDRRPDCEDASDELDCGCQSDEFTCLSGARRCIPSVRQCDRRRDCEDGSDEAGCGCSDNEFTCRSGARQCIPSNRQCDRRRDCEDGSDEENCACQANEFTCNSGDCIPLDRKCDGQYHCRDGSDEVDCGCRDDQFTCTGGSVRCIPQERKCDRRSDCDDGSDENDCGCLDNEFTCTSGRRKCIPSNRQCDRRRDCEDGSDELNCGCRDGEFTCGNGDCIPANRKCDRRIDCRDRSDEEGCGCSRGEFQCNNGDCIPESFKCNGRRECEDGSDEFDCSCREDQFQCDNGQCIDERRRCDRRYDCRDGSDETQCSRPIVVTVTPRVLMLREGRQADFVCSVTGSSAVRLQWSRSGNLALPAKASSENGRLVIPELQLGDSGEYVCSAVGVAGDYQAVARLEVRRIGPGTTPAPVGPCGPGQSVCQNNECIPSDYRCDGDKDCSDGSDELYCTTDNPCEPNEFRCTSGLCVMKIWRCDGDNDCGDGFDEADCPTGRPGDQCRPDEYQCSSGDQCVPASYQCDGEIDCQDRSDEIGCSVPTIILAPVPRIDVEIGGQFTIICEAMGTPTPLIVWRLNWGNIPTGNRIYTSSIDGRGNLTITNAIIDDSGAYTCEAINTKGTIFASPDAIVIVRRTPQGVCNPPLFNVEAAISSECVRCFCFGHTTDCYSSDLHVSEIALVGKMTLVKQDPRRGDIPAEVTIQENPRGTFQIRDFIEVLPSGNYYWNLPGEFTGDRLTSYGGTLKYTIYYEVVGQRRSTSHADVVLKGNGITLYHRTATILRPGAEITISVPLLPSAWEKTDASSGPRGDIPATEPATREDLMMVLENVEAAYVRANYDVSQLTTRIHTVELTTGVIQDTGRGRAVYVEDCQCPPGYAGLSCQDCATGYRRVRQGPYLGICRRCNCNGHSTDCDPNTGECRFCQHNTVGAQCERCLTGFYGDATLGTADACRPCPCPLTVAPNQFSSTCVVGSDGQPTCTDCPEGYEGRNCERCASGYVGNPRSPGDYCRPITVEDRCDSRGSLQRRPDPSTGRCPCKEYVTGPNCDRCKNNTFYLAVENPNGCIACFCMGVTERCTSTSWNRAQVGASFTRDSQGFSLTDITRNPDLTVSDGFTINRNVRELVYRGFSRLPNTVYYWSLPQRFLGNKVMSYGGNLRFVVMYRPGQDSGITSGPLVQLIGNDITLVYRPNRSPVPNTPESYNIKLYEAEWTRLNGQPTTREFLMMALADLDAILIRATFTRDTDQASIRDVTMDIAEERPTGQDRAYTVENCVCPEGYRGLSCEDCDVGFKRAQGGLYLGICERCECNQHSGECDPETGQCRNCQHNTEGNNCERCAAGFYGDATRGSPVDCQPCPCPLTEPPNQFSPTCILDADGQVTCNACPAGHTGRRCERCIQGYTGNPLNPGDYCKIGPIEPDCNCDSRGTVLNTQCDPVSKQCQCKSYVQGLRCNNCKEGYFHLSENNAQGCLACWCSGITTQCSSSNYYREEPQISADGSHNFALTTRRLSNPITDGFTVDIARNEVAFTQFEGIQREQESLFFSLPPKFRGNRVTSYGGYLRFTLETTVPLDGGRTFRDVDLEFITTGQTQRMYYLFNPSVRMNSPNSYEVLLRESTFRMLDGSEPTRGTFLSILSDIEAILIRATYHTITGRTSLRDLRMDSAVATPTGLPRAPMVESCRCPQGYTGLSCEQCAAGYLRVQESGRIQCVRCNCNGHATSCDSVTGQCLNCQHNTAGDRCEICAVGYYGDATVGTSNDCRPCPCPLTVPSNQFSRSCYLAQDNQVTCDRCPTGYTGRDCGECDARRGYFGNPKEIGGSCRLETDDLRPIINVNPTRLEETVGGTVVFQCNVRGNGPFNVIWSRVGSQQLSTRAQTGPQYSLTIRDIVESDSGRYFCTATNIYGSRREYVTLVVLGRKQPIRVRIEEPREVNVNEGTSVRFVCLASGSREMTYILSWTKQGTGLPDKAIDQNGVLVIPNVRREDAGNYVCTGSDMTSMDKAVATLIVSASQEGPQVYIEPRFQTVKEGDVVLYTCTASGIPVPTIEWRKSSGPLNSEATVVNGVLRIPRARKSDESEYYCKATNVAGSSEVRTILYVQKDESLPDITVIVRQTSIIAVIGTTAQLYCYVEDSAIRPTLVWSRSGGLPSGSSQEGGVLTLTNIQPSSSGTYICTATTPTGDKGTATTEVVVQDARERPEVSVDPQRITIAMGTTGTIRCEVTGKPQPSITWTKSRGKLTARHQVNAAVLRIVNAQMEDRGIYVCRAENVAGVAQGWVIVEIERRMKPKVDIVPNPTQTIQVGGSALFQCRVMDGDPPPKITWKRAGDEALTSNVDIMENGVIMFKSVTGEEAGAYICTATNDMGSVSATATLTIQGPPRIVIQPSTTIYAVVGQRVTVECIAEGDPTPSVYWKYDIPVRRGDIPLTPNFAERATPGSATLTLESVATTDSGNYVCVANNNVGGDVQRNVQIIVQEQVAGVRGVSISGPNRLTVEEGQAVSLQCNTQGLINPVVSWRRKNGVLPPNHSVRGGTLYIPRFMAEYSGEYICSASTAQRNYEASVFIIVTVRPSLTISPARIEARAGQGIQLTCTPQGTGPFQIEWSKVDSALSPQARQTSDGVLTISAVTAADAGRYRCLATSSSGSSDGYAEVTVQVPPTIVAEARESRAVVGQRSVSLSCNARGSPVPEIRWSKQGGELPVQHTVRDGVLTIYGVREEDSGQYVCTATSSIGVARDYLYLRTTPRVPVVDPTVKIDTQTVNVGERVEMECVVTGTPRPVVTWSKLDGPLPRSAEVNDVFLVIPEVTIDDAGTYVCTAQNVVGRVEQRVTLFVRARPLITGSGDSFTAALGTSATLSCEAAGYPEPEITWYRRDGKMPREYDIENGELRIKQVMPEDAGTYMCEARNELGSNQHAQELKVGDLVPHFTQNPISYIRYPTMSDAYHEVDVLLSIRPETTDGLVLYNGQYETGTGDYVCFGLSEGYPEFRFDVGSGPAIIRGDNKMDLDKWHTVKLTRTRKQGTMVVDDEPQYTGTSQGRFEGLDLNTDMYLGGVPDYRALPIEAGFTQGFVGSVSRVALKGVDLNLGAEALEIVGVELFHACQSSPCMNGGKCQISNTAEGFSCLCPHGYTGMRCDVTGQKCHQGACGPDGRCVNLSDRAGYKCICPMGQTGNQCLTSVSIMSPEFNRTSFVSYPPVKGARFQMKIDLQFKPSKLDDGIILYSGQSEDGSGDFVSIAIRDGNLEYKYNTGSGPATMKSRRPLRLGEWTRVSVAKNGKEGSLVVNGDDPVQVRPWSYYRDQYRNYYNYHLSRLYRYRRATSPGNTVGLDLRTKLYLGGVEPGVIIPRNIQVTQGFSGCITQLTVNMQDVDLIQDALETLDVQDCGDRNICNRQPCINGGACESISLHDYRCTCPEGFRGKNCEIRVNICNTQAPCRNGGVCSITNQGYRCDCPLNFSGDNCENAVTYTGPIEVQGDGFVEFNKDKFPHSQTQEEEIVTLKIKANSGNGLLFWHGQATPGQPLQNGDYLSIGLQDGYVKYSYELGSGPVTMRSLRPVFDGNVHTITVTRLGKDGTLAVDGGPKVTGSSRGILQMLNARGNVYVGGVPDVDTMTGGRYTQNFNGCILEIHLQDKGPFKVPEDTAGGYNVLPCNS